MISPRRLASFRESITATGTSAGTTQNRLEAGATQINTSGALLNAVVADGKLMYAASR